MLKRSIWLRLACVVVTTVPASALAADLDGVWEIQSMGADREVRIEQQGSRLVAHRVMWPEFEGQKYKLEHLYRGRISGKAIRGDLLVKEEELPDFEVLRPFDGSIDGADRMTLDGLPLRRIRKTGPARAPGIEAPRVRPDKPQRPLDPPALSRAEPPATPAAAYPTLAETTSAATASADAALAATAACTAPANAAPAYITPAGVTPAETAPADTAAGAAPAEETDDSSTTLFANILGTPGMGDLVRVSRRVTIPDEANPLIARGDELMAAGKYNAALAKFEEAAGLTQGKHVQLMQRMGRCEIRLGRYMEARSLLRRALRLDPGNRALRADYELAKRRAARRR